MARLRGYGKAAASLLKHSACGKCCRSCRRTRSPAVGPGLGHVYDYVLDISGIRGIAVFGTG
jgi:hypothetical protein